MGMLCHYLPLQEAQLQMPKTNQSQANFPDKQKTAMANTWPPRTLPLAVNSTPHQQTALTPYDLLHAAKQGCTWPYKVQLLIACHTPQSGSSSCHHTLMSSSLFQHNTSTRQVPFSTCTS